MLKNKNILCFSPANWNGRTEGSCKRFMRIFAKENSVLYINNISISIPSVKKIGTNAFIKRINGKLKGHLKAVWKAGQNIYVYNPIMLPLVNDRIRKINILLLRLQIQSLMKILSFKDPIIWIENPVGISVAENLSREMIVYYRTDKFESYRDIRNPGLILEFEEKLDQEADLIFCVSSKLFKEKLKTREKSVYYLPHGVDFYHFNAAASNLPIPEDIRRITHPIVGYFGSLTDSNDELLIRYCATRRPDFSFVLIGDVGSRFESLTDLPNVHFLGYKGYELLPQYGKAFDVCIMFWKVTEWIEHCNPVKTMEYLAMGKPVVSVAIDEISTKFIGIVSVGRSHEEFLQKIEEELENDSAEKQRERIDFVRNETWEARAKNISRILMKEINSRAERNSSHS